MEILFQDDSFIAINKPAGLLVHPSRIAPNAKTSAMQLLRDQIGSYVYPIHRLDRKTSGVLLFALSKASLSAVSEQFRDGLVRKVYLSINRGYVEEKGIIDYALTNSKGKVQHAVTHYKCLAQTEIPLAHGGHETSRYSMLELRPLTGRFHQLRKHLAHIRHPIIGDRPHGCNKQNRLFKKEFALMEMMLWARSLKFHHPEKGAIEIRSNPSPEFLRIAAMLNFDLSYLLTNVTKPI